NDKVAAVLANGRCGSRRPFAVSSHHVDGILRSASRKTNCNYEGFSRECPSSYLPPGRVTGPADFRPRRDAGMSISRLASVAILLCAVSVGAGAGDPAPAPAIEAVVDRFLDERLREDGVTPAPAADDATILRRLTLDLAGRIPTVGELDAYTSSTDPDKKTKLVDRLMASPGFVRHQAAEFDRLLMNRYRGSVR